MEWRGVQPGFVRREMRIHREEPHESAYDDTGDCDEVEGDAPSFDAEDRRLCQHQGEESSEYGAYAARQLQPAKCRATVIIVSGVGDQRLDCWYDKS